MLGLLCMTSAYETASDGGETRLDAYLAGVAEGDTASFEQLYHATRIPVYAFAFSILKNTHDAEDVTHDCYVRLHAVAGEYRSQGKPLAWILTMVKNLCLMKLREQKKTAEMPVEEWDAVLPVKEELDIDDRLLLEAYLEELTAEERQIVVLHAVSGFKHREIARLTGLPLSTVLSKYNRAVKKLKKRLQGGLDNEE